jgi:RHS repeat-associated protein
MNLQANSPTQTAENVPTSRARAGIRRRALRGARLLLWAAALFTLLAAQASPTSAQSCSCGSGGTKSCNKVKVGFAASVCSARGYTVSFGGKTANGTGSCTADTWVTTPKQEVEVTIDKPYQLVAGSDSCSTHVVFDAPKGYRVVVDGVETKTIDKGGTTKGSGDGTWEVIVHKCSECENKEDVEACDMNADGGVNWSASLGKLSDGRSAQTISIREDFISSAIYTPAALTYSPPLSGEIDVVRGADGNIRQIRVPRALADVVVISPQEYEVRFYDPANVGAKSGGLYPVTGQPFATWKFKNPDPTSTSRLQISDTEGATTTTSEYTWDSVSNTWVLDESAGTRVETKTVAYLTDTSRVETDTVKDSAGQVVSKVARTIHTFPWGDEVLEVVVDPDGAALKTTYAYYEDPAEAGRYSKLKTMTLPNGSWEKYDYDSQGNQTVVLRPWKDLTLAAATESNSYATFYTYTNSDGITLSPYPYLVSTVTEKVEGVTVRKTTYTRTGTQIDGEPATVETATVYSSAAATLTTTTTTYHSTASPQLANKVAAVVHPDGTKETYKYEKGDYVANADPALSQFTPNPNGAAWRETLTHGTASSPDGVALKTMRETTVRDQHGHTVLTESYVYTGSGYERVGWAAMDYDGRGNLTRTRRSNGEVTTAVWDGYLMTSSTDLDGVETAYTYDALGRVKTETTKGVAATTQYPAQPDMVTTYTYDARDRVTSETLAGGGASLSRSTTYDGASRVKTETNTEGLTTTHTYTNGGRTHTVTYPGGATLTTDTYLDGQPKDVTGTAVVARHYDYAVAADGTLTTQDFKGGPASPRWTNTTADWLGRQIKVETPGFTGQSLVRMYTYNDKGQLVSRAISGGATKLTANMLSEYDALGRVVRNGLDLDSNGLLEPGSTDRFTESDLSFKQEGADWFESFKVSTYLNDNDATKTDMKEERQRLNNFPSSGSEVTVSEARATDEAGQTTIVYRRIDRAAKKATVTVDTPDSNVDSVRVSVNDLLQSSTPATPEAATTYSYDGLGRVTGVNIPQSGTLTKSYHPTTGLLLTEGDAVQTTTYDYYPAGHANAGRLRSRMDAKGKKTFFDYDARGKMTRMWGDAAYPVEYAYDNYGQRTEVRTYRGGQNWGASIWPASTAGAADVTQLIYNEPTGLLEKKRDAAVREMSYAYDALGRTTTRVWSRTDALGNPVSATYSYDPLAGDMVGVDYSDSTPDATFAYDRGGRPRTISDASGTRTRTYDPRGDLKTESISGGILDLVQVNASYDDFTRRQFVQAVYGASVLVSQTYGYDASSRLETIASGGQSVTYGYHPASGLLSTTSYTGGTVVGRSYDGLGRTQSITTTPAADAAQSYTYTYNNLSQRTRVTREDGSYWAYEYDDRDELTSGKKFWPDNTPVLGAQTEYAFDNIGNRTSSRAGGNTLGALRQSVYTANSLNQYTQRTAPGAADVTGTANASATVSVNNEATARRGDYFYKEMSVNNAAGPVYAQVNVVGARNNFGAGGEDAVTERGGRVYVPQAVEAYSYDADGNLTADGRWNYTWDAENRLTSMEARPDVPVEARLRLEFAYDWAGRRIQKKVYAWDAATSGYQLQSVTKFIHDGWNLMAELDGAGAPVRGYVWGQDLSGSLGDAGGTGGLLMVNQGGNTYHVGYDASGNVTTLVNAATGKTAASYEYDPFGNTLKAVGDFASSNPFRFSTKYADAETGLVYYGERYYQPQTGRWLSRDPLGEDGGVNIYAFVGNSPVSHIDPTGLYEIDVHYYLTYYLALQTRCFSPAQAKMIAEGNQDTDENPEYAPNQTHGFPDSIKPVGEVGEKQRERHRKYHALTDRSEDPWRLAELMKPALKGVNENGCGGGQKFRKEQLTAFGRYLHYYQDTFSHHDFTDPWIGHFLAGHDPDHTNQDVAKAMNMARGTYDELSKYASKLKCCTPAPMFGGNVQWDKVEAFMNLPSGDKLNEISDPELDAKRKSLSDYTGRFFIPMRHGNRVR